MKVRLVFSNGSKNDFLTISELKAFCHKYTVTISVDTLLRVLVFRVTSDGKRTIFPHGIRTLYDFINYYRI